MVVLGINRKQIQLPAEFISPPSSQLFITYMTLFLLRIKLRTESLTLATSRLIYQVTCTDSRVKDIGIFVDHYLTQIRVEMCTFLTV